MPAIQRRYAAACTHRAALRAICRGFLLLVTVSARCYNPIISTPGTDDSGCRVISARILERNPSMRLETLAASGRTFPLTWVHTLVIGSGAAGLNAAVQLRANGVDDVLIVTRGPGEGHVDQHRQRQADLLQALALRHGSRRAGGHGRDLLRGRLDARRPGPGRGQPLGPRLPPPGQPRRPLPPRRLRPVRGLQDRPRPAPARHLDRPLHLARDVPRADPRGGAAGNSGARGAERRGVDN